MQKPGFGNRAKEAELLKTRQYSRTIAVCYDVHSAVTKAIVSFSLENPPYIPVRAVLVPGLQRRNGWSACNFRYQINNFIS